jgi:hypothetical protein
MCFYHIDRQIGRCTLVPSRPIIIRQRSAKIDKTQTTRLFSIASRYHFARIASISLLLPPPPPSISVVVCLFLTV